MSDQTADFQRIAEQLGQLHKENLRLKRMGSGLLLIVGALLLMGQAAPARRGTNKRISTEELILTDAAGRMRATFYADANKKGPSLVFYNLQGEPRMSLFVDSDKDEPTIYLVSGAKEGAVAAVQPTLIELTDSSDRIVSLKMTPTVSGFMLGDAASTRASLALNADEPALVLFDKAIQKPAMLLTADGNGPRLGLWDRKGYSAILGVDGVVRPATGETYKTSAASLVLRDNARKVIWSAP